MWDNRYLADQKVCISRISPEIQNDAFWQVSHSKAEQQLLNAAPCVGVQPFWSLRKETLGIRRPTCVGWLPLLSFTHIAANVTNEAAGGPLILSWSAFVETRNWYILSGCQDLIPWSFCCGNGFGLNILQTPKRGSKLVCSSKKAHILEFVAELFLNRTVCVCVWLHNRLQDSLDQVHEKSKKTKECDLSG